MRESLERTLAGSATRGKTTCADLSGDLVGSFRSGRRDLSTNKKLLADAITSNARHGRKRIVDTGPMVALLDADDEHHAWVKAQFGRLRPPLLTCEAILTQSCFLIARGGGDASAVVQLAERGVLSVAKLFDSEAASLARLMRRYKDVPMSLADACLVRLIELTPQSTLFTLDSDFEIYRQKGRRLIPLLAPRRK